MAQWESHIQQLCKSFHCNIDAESEENCNAVLEPAPPVANDDADVDNGK